MGLQPLYLDLSLIVDHVVVKVTSFCVVGSSKSQKYIGKWSELTLNILRISRDFVGMFSSRNFNLVDDFLSLTIFGNHRSSDLIKARMAMAMLPDSGPLSFEADLRYPVKIWASAPAVVSSTTRLLIASQNPMPLRFENMETLSVHGPRAEDLAAWQVLCRPNLQHCFVEAAPKVRLSPFMGAPTLSISSGQRLPLCRVTIQPRPAHQRPTCPGRPVWLHGKKIALHVWESRAFK